MSYKQFVPDVGEEWDEYWKKTSISKELKLIDTDGLRPIFSKFLPKKGKILEAGCGMGKWVVDLSKKGYDIIGVDNNKYALKKLNEFDPKTKVRLADVTKLPYADETYDAYLSLGVIEHFEEGPQKALSEAYRILKRGGLAIVEVPFDSLLRKITRLFTMLLISIKTPARITLQRIGLRKPRERFKMMFYEYRYTVQELTDFMKEAGFEDMKIISKDDLKETRSIGLWLDYQFLHHPNGELFELNDLGKIVKAVLNFVSPFTYSALIVAVAKKK